MANKVLKDRTAVKQKINGDYPWTYNAPTKDVAHSGCLSAGNDYGIGIRQPVGKETASGLESGPIPQKARAFSPKEIFEGSKGKIAEDERG
jgi:hypothetical protein